MANLTPPSQVQISASNTQPSVSPSHYRGVRLRGRKWTSEVYNKRESKNVRIGTYSTPEMAAIAHDVASLAFNGVTTRLNFPDAIGSLLVPKSTSIVDIRAAATTAAEQFNMRPEVVGASGEPSQEIIEYVDEDELFNMPQLLIEMAEGLMVSPPRFGPPYD